jgi:protease-4
MSKAKQILLKILSFFKRSILVILRFFGKSFAITFGVLSGIVFFVLIISILTLPFQPKENEEKTQINQNISYFYGQEESKNIIARLELFGDVIDPYQEERMPAFFGQPNIIDGMVISSQLAELAKQDNVKGIILDLSTYGGSPAGAQLILDAVKNYQKKTNKPVWTFVADSSYSAGAYLSASSNKIFATKTAGVGSIGVVGPTLIKTEGMTGIMGLEARNIQIETLSEGRNKAPKNPFNQTEEELVAERRMMKNMYDEFVKVMVENRKIDEEVLRNKMGAEIFIAGKEGLEYDLVDEIATRNQVFEKMATELKIQDNFVVNTYTAIPKNDFGLFSGFEFLPSVLKKDSQTTNPRASLCRENRILFYHGNVNKDLCGR